MEVNWISSFCFFLLTPPPMHCLQILDKKGEAVEAESSTETSSEAPDSSSNSRSFTAGVEAGVLSAEQPFIKLSQEEYGEHHSSIMHCRSDWMGAIDGYVFLKVGRGCLKPPL